MVTEATHGCAGSQKNSGAVSLADLEAQQDPALELSHLIKAHRSAATHGMKAVVLQDLLFLQILCDLAGCIQVSCYTWDESCCTARPYVSAKTAYNLGSCIQGKS